MGGVRELPESRSHSVAGVPLGLPRLITGKRASQGAQVNRQAPWEATTQNCPCLQQPSPAAESAEPKHDRQQSPGCGNLFLRTQQVQKWCPKVVTSQSQEEAPVAPGVHREGVQGLALPCFQPPCLLGGPCLSNRHDDVLWEVWPCVWLQSPCSALSGSCLNFQAQGYQDRAWSFF